MTVSQKINDIAILKAMGFNGKDVIKIFVTQAISIGLMGVFGGVIIAVILISFLKKIYLGGDIGYFPIDYEFSKFKVNSYERIYDVNLDMISKILNNTKFKYNLNKLNNIDFL